MGEMNACMGARFIANNVTILITDTPSQRVHYRDNRLIFLTNSRASHDFQRQDITADIATTIIYIRCKHHTMTVNIGSVHSSFARGFTHERVLGG